MLTLIAYLPVFNAEFVNWDDGDYGYDNILIRSFDNFGKFFITPVQGNYHPLTMISLAINCAISGENASSYHIFNVLFHLANTALAYLLAWRLSNGKFWVALLTGLLFGIHTMHVESVAWVSERKDVLYTFFFLLGLIGYERYVKKPSTTGYLAFTGLLLLSLASKPAAVVFPLTLLVLDYWLKRPMKLDLIVEKIPHFALALLAGLLTLKAQTLRGATDVADLMPFSRPFFFGCYSFMMYWVKLIFPVNLCTFYPFPPINEGLPIIYLISPLFLLATIGLAFLTRKKTRLFIFTLAFFLVNIGLVLQFFVVGSAVMADRYAYLPYWSAFFMLGFGLDYLVEEKKLLTKTAAYALLGALGLLLTALSYRQATTWKNSATLWDNAIKVHPSSKAFTNRAIVHRKANEGKTALELLNKAIALSVRDADAYGTRGNVYFDMKQYEKALADLNMSLQINEKNANAYNSRGAVYGTLGQNDLALADMNKSIELDPLKPESYTNRAILHSTMKNNVAASADYKTYLEKFNPGNSNIWNDLGISYFSMGDFNKALESFKKATQISPENGIFYLNSSRAYFSLGDKSNALTYANQAQKKGAQVPQDFLLLLQQ